MMCAVVAGAVACILALPAALRHDKALREAGK
ncbi:membrane protein [Arthrobacter phage Berka]|nr:membrane protein [Arthrobacter phage Berka]